VVAAGALVRPVTGFAPPILFGGCQIFLFVSVASRLFSVSDFHFQLEEFNSTPERSGARGKH